VGNGSKILDGLRDAVAGNFVAVTIEGETWVKKGHETPEHQLMELRGKVADLQLQNDCLRSALAPFSKALDDLPSWAPECPDNTSIWDSDACEVLKYGDLRYARSVFDGK
jgi:hypothetical protein